MKHLHRVHCAPEPSPRLLRACGMLGVGVAPAHRPPTTPTTPAARARALDRALTGRPGAQIALVIGPSGSGKTRFLAEFRRVHADRTRRLVVLRPPSGRSTIDAMPGPLPAAMAALAAAGLGEAGVLARQPRQLSEGERFRLSLAAGLVAAGSGRRVTLLCDEFASVLDRGGAKRLALAVRRAILKHPGVRLICATAHRDIAAWLRPDITIRPQPDSHRPEAA